jgi:transcription elongation factor GreA
MADKTPISREGYQQLENDLNYLRNVRMSEMALRLHEIREEGGDPGESTEYADAMMEQAQIQGKIQQIEDQLSRALIIDEVAIKVQKGVVALNRRVTVQEEGDEPEEFHILGPIEADPATGKISVESPLGRALMGKKVGDVVTVQAPDGSFAVKIIAVE